jgi:hypothetical protein
LNAIGNRVPPRNWGTDNAIGHLDLGQFDHWQHAPSASLTVQLMTRRAWEDVGPIDEAFPAYYEDADWAYRARLAGWTIGVMPEAEAFHIFGGFWDVAEGGGLTPRKLRTAIIGRLRFTIRITGRQRLRAHLKNCFFEDLGNVITECRQGHYASALNYPRAWAAVALQLPSLIAQRRRLQRTRKVSDDTLFPADDSMPCSYVLRNSPLLTSSIVRNEYAPLLRRGATRPVPELTAD